MRSIVLHMFPESHLSNILIRTKKNIKKRFGTFSAKDLLELHTDLKEDYAEIEEQEEVHVQRLKALHLLEKAGALEAIFEEATDNFERKLPQLGEESLQNAEDIHYKDAKTPIIPVDSNGLIAASNLQWELEQIRDDDTIYGKETQPWEWLYGRRPIELPLLAGDDDPEEIEAREKFKREIEKTIGNEKDPIVRMHLQTLILDEEKKQLLKKLPNSLRNWILDNTSKSRDHFVSQLRDKRDMPLAETIADSLRPLAPNKLQAFFNWTLRRKGPTAHFVFVHGEGHSLGVVKGLTKVLGLRKLSGKSIKIKKHGTVVDIKDLGIQIPKENPELDKKVSALRSEFKKAKQELQQTIDSIEKEPDFWKVKAETLTQEERIDEAQVWLRKIAKRDIEHLERTVEAADAGFNAIEYRSKLSVKLKTDMLDLKAESLEKLGRLEEAKEARAEIERAKKLKFDK